MQCRIAQQNTDKAAELWLTFKAWLVQFQASYFTAD
jgi:hypothetical protein